MDLHASPSFAPATRHDGWSPALKARFLAVLAEKGNVRAAAARCGMSAQSAYMQRRRDPIFALGWAGALVLAREHGEQVLADRALEGVEEQIFYRGELVGTRRRYDSRLLLAHLGRLDRLAEDEEAERAAGRFDELLAIVAGEKVPCAFHAPEDDPWPEAREPFAEAAATQAQLAVVAEHTSSPRKFDPGAAEACDAALVSAGQAARAAAEAEWDEWFARACALVDGLAEGPPKVSRSAVPPRGGEGEEFFLRTETIVSTSPFRPAVADRGDQRYAAVRIGEGGCARAGADRCDGVLEAGEPAFADPVEGE